MNIKKIITTLSTVAVCSCRLWTISFNRLGDYNDQP